MKIYLHKFASLEKEAIKAFTMYWKKQHDKEPEHFPMDMALGEWWEQYVTWQSLKEEEK